MKNSNFLQNKKNILVLMGGKSPEHEVSVVSGIQVVKNLDSRKFNVFPVIASRDGKSFRLVSKEKLLAFRSPLSLKESKGEIVAKNYQNIESISRFEKIDLVFIAMHGPFGEDGTVQGMFELSGIPYTGSGVLASALCMDKIMFRKVMNHEGFKTPRFVVIDKSKNLKSVKKILGQPPYFVKPHNQGSSVGASLVEKYSDLSKAVNLALKYSDKVLVDEYVKGIEVTCAVLGSEFPRALPVIEIVPKKGSFFNYKSKYTDGGADEIVPARISKKLTQKIQSLSLEIYKTLSCRGFARVDFILKDNKNPVLLEVNTIPGLTPASLFPKAAKAAGISYKKLIERVISYAQK